MPDGVDALSAAIRRAVGEGRRVVPRGSGEWWPGAPPGALVLPPAPAALERVDAADHVATAGGGCTLADLDRALAARGAFVALDPPGGLSRTLGGVLASGGGGPLAAGFGPPRDQVLGLTFVTGDGTAVKTGGRVVKNVAGFDLSKALVGSHGGFGVIVQVHLRLRTRAAADRAMALSGSVAELTRAAGRLQGSGCTPAAFEVLSPELAAELGISSGWTILLRAMGTPEGVDEELAAVAAAVRGLRVRPGTCPESPDPWTGWRAAVARWPVVLRVGADPVTWPQAVSLVERHAGTALGSSVTVPRGTVRVGLEALPPAAAAAIRHDAAGRGWPVTLERAGAGLRADAGVWGALGSGALVVTERLRRVFDPHDVFDVPLLGGIRDGRPA